MAELKFGPTTTRQSPAATGFALRTVRTVRTVRTLRTQF